MTSAPVDQLRAALADRYRLERELGHGGMATVYLAHDLRHDRDVALKVLHPDLAQALGVERFQREIMLAARLQHPNILSVFDSGAAGGNLWFTMPFVDGESLRDRLRRETQLPVDDALRIATETARALEYAHQHGVIHRDIKPENLLLTRDGSTLVTDFGIARALSEGADQLTQTGMTVGTPAYMSPEQAAGSRDLDARTDIYSLGTVLYEMLAGERPFTGPNAQVITAKRLSGEVPPMRRVRPAVPEHVDQAVTRAMAPVSADRFQTASEFARSLRTTVASPLSAPTVPSPAASRPARSKIALALGLGVLIGVGVLFAWRQSRDTVMEPEGMKVLAVLPFENLGDSTDAYFADGVADEVRARLATLGGLTVIARGSSNEYRHTKKPAQDIARELGARYLLTATVRWNKSAGNPSRVRVTPELVDVGHGHAPQTRWGEPFDADLTDVFQVQADVAGKVAAALNVALGDSARQSLAAQPTASLAAYELFLKGEEVSRGGSALDPATLRHALSYYERAVAADSTFVKAWVSIAVSRAWIWLNEGSAPAEADASRRAAERASALRPGGYEGHLAMGSYLFITTTDYAGVVSEATQGLRALPGQPDLLRLRGDAEMHLGSWDAALMDLQRAQRLDPRSISTARELSDVLLYMRRYPEALAASDRGLMLDPSNVHMLRTKAMIHLAQGDLAGARASIDPMHRVHGVPAMVLQVGALFWMLTDEEQQNLLRLSPGSFNHPGTRAMGLTETYWQRGDRTKARVHADSGRQVFEEVVQKARDDWTAAFGRAGLGIMLAFLGRKSESIAEMERAATLVPMTKDAVGGPTIQFSFAYIYVLVGEPEKALDKLQPLLEVPFFLSPGWLKVDPTFAPLRGNQRFERLVNGT